MNETMQRLVDKLNERLIHPEKDYDLFLEELQDIGLSFDEDLGWHYDDEKNQIKL